MRGKKNLKALSEVNKLERKKKSSSYYRENVSNSFYINWPLASNKLPCKLQ